MPPISFSKGGHTTSPLPPSVTSGSLQNTRGKLEKSEGGQVVEEDLLNLCNIRMEFYLTFSPLLLLKLSKDELRMPLCSDGI